MSAAAIDEPQLAHRQIMTIFSGLILGLFLAAITAPTTASPGLAAAAAGRPLRAAPPA